MPVGRRRSAALVTLPPLAFSSAPKFTENAICCASVSFWPRNTSTANLSMPASMAATSACESGWVMSMPETSPAKLG